MRARVCVCVGGEVPCACIVHVLYGCLCTLGSLLQLERGFKVSALFKESQQYEVTPFPPQLLLHHCGGYSFRRKAKGTVVCQAAAAAAAAAAGAAINVLYTAKQRIYLHCISHTLGRLACHEKCAEEANLKG